MIEDIPATRPVTAPSPAEEREALDRAVAEMLPPLAAGLMVVWLVFAAGHALILSAQPRTLMLALGLGSAALRGIDTLNRYGGEEFVALLPETGPEQAFEVAAARLRANEEPGRLLEAADAALYRARAEGRNRSVRAEAMH